MNVKVICFYLPQFHPIRENNIWWGEGFTEWNSVVRGERLFPSHYQPHLPADLGFYDLRLDAVREAQAGLAKEYGIGGFCYYHYWFNGRRILERPLTDMLSSGKPNFPFCLCWANENWTRAWDGGETEILLSQEYSEEDDVAHIRALIPAFKDPRYIRIGGRPLFLVYRTENMPDPAATAQRWREEARRAGIGDIYLARVEGFRSDIDPSTIGFDAAVEFAPDWRTLNQFLYRSRLFRLGCRLGLLPPTYLSQSISSYHTLAERMLRKRSPSWKWFRCATPGFDNSARRRDKGAAIFHKSSPKQYERWLTTLLDQAQRAHEGDERIVFVNAWNEWAEGNHLEPDQRFGRAYLEATRSAMVEHGLGGDNEEGQVSMGRAQGLSSFQRLRQFYWAMGERLSEFSEFVRHVLYWQGRRLMSLAERGERRPSGEGHKGGAGRPK